MTPCYLAFDPGPSNTAWGVVAREGDRLHLTDSGLIASTPQNLKDILSKVLCNAVAVEALSGYLASKARASSLFDTAEIAGLIRGLAHPAPVYALPANAPGKRPSWRYHLTGNPRAGDADVKAALKLHLELTDKELKALKVHERDALGLACVIALCDRNGQLEPLKV